MGIFVPMAERTGFEPATPGVTGRYSNQLNYRSVFLSANSSVFASNQPAQAGITHNPLMRIIRPSGSARTSLTLQSVLVLSQPLLAVARV